MTALLAPPYWYGENAAAQTTRWREARHEFREHASWGDSLAMAGLHYCYAFGLGEATRKTDPKEAYRWAQEASLVGDPPGVGEYLLGRCYAYGIGVEKNMGSALRLFRESADKGFVLGEIALAERIFLNQPNETDARRARELLRQGISQEIPHAMTALADAYVRGDQGLPRLMEKGISLYRSA